MNAPGRPAGLSPDGPRSRSRPIAMGNNEIYVMNANGSGQSTSPQYRVGLTPAWSHDGTRSPSNRTPDRLRLWVMNADGSNPCASPIQHAAGARAGSPDGTRIAYEQAAISGS